MAKISGKYEIVYIIDPAQGEEGIAALVEKFKAMVEAEGTLTSIEEWGKRRLAYPINDLPEGYAPKEVLAMLNKRRDRIFCVRGNCDGEVDQMVLDFPIMADYAVLTEGERLIYATHGHVYNTAHLPPLQPGDILLHGHTHVPAWQAFGEGNLYLNPGSVSLPKENSPHSYLTLEGGKFLWKELDGTVYHELNI